MRLAAFLMVFPALCQDGSSFHVNVHLVNVAFSVHDSSGVLIPNLAKEDFEVFDDGVPQTIAYFARSAELPLTLGLIADVSGSQDRFLKRHRRDLEKFLDQVLIARDRAFLMCFGNHLRLASDFTSSAPNIMDGLDVFEHGRHRLPELAPDDTRALGTAFYDAIYYGITEKLAGTEGARKALVVFSDGEDNSSSHHLLDAIETAQRENVMIFNIRYTETQKGRLTARNRYGIRVMARLAAETGGLDFDAQKSDLSQAFSQIGEELRSSYELAYHSNHPVSDGTFHKLVIRAKRPGLKIRTKTGYFAGD